MPTHCAALCKGKYSGDDTGEGQTRVCFPSTHPVTAAAAGPDHAGDAVGGSLLCTPAGSPLLPPQHLTEHLETW